MSQMEYIISGRFDDDENLDIYGPIFENFSALDFPWNSLSRMYRFVFLYRQTCLFPRVKVDIFVLKTQYYCRAEFTPTDRNLDFFEKKKLHHLLARCLYGTTSDWTVSLSIGNQPFEEEESTVISQFQLFSWTLRMKDGCSFQKTSKQLCWHDELKSCQQASTKYNYVRWTGACERSTWKRSVDISIAK